MTASKINALTACRWPDCDGPHKSKGCCGNHYNRVLAMVRDGETTWENHVEWVPAWAARRARVSAEMSTRRVAANAARATRSVEASQAAVQVTPAVERSSTPTRAAKSFPAPACDLHGGAACPKCEERPVAVCIECQAQGVSRDEDLCCATCGCDLVVCADIHSAEVLLDRVVSPEVVSPRLPLGAVLGVPEANDRGDTPLRTIRDIAGRFSSMQDPVERARSRAAPRMDVVKHCLDAVRTALHPDNDFALVALLKAAEMVLGLDVDEVARA